MAAYSLLFYTEHVKKPDGSKNCFICIRLSPSSILLIYQSIGLRSSHHLELCNVDVIASHFLENLATETQECFDGHQNVEVTRLVTH